ncbi:hypothetical protein PYV02_14755 [Leifsonia sp. H3M29-4]|jgi:hypothetical protein|uniref:hypothetical protein n=1 Tax=Salinibacterium metalliresistens TaxID=3031321 RepID=UPI0023DC8519|nr:hypothetical protein [Salinibacterium metalliresistens]MDF1480343.1 hypothetical protein [Salinibacterium metalliresistens]
MRYLFALVPSIDVPPPAAPPGAENILLIVSWIFWAAAIAGIIGLIVLGGTMALANQQGRGAPEFAGRLGMVAVGIVLIGAAGGIVTLLLGV